MPKRKPPLPRSGAASHVLAPGITRQRTIEVERNALYEAAGRNFAHAVSLPVANHLGAQRLTCPAPPLCKPRYR